jgi:hypothetical protein
VQSILFNGTGTMNFFPSTTSHLLKIPQPICTTGWKPIF